MIYRDEIVDEVRRVREKHAAKFNYDTPTYAQGKWIASE